MWQGNPKDWSEIMSSPSSWSLDGEPLPFVPYVSTEEKERLGYTNRHAASLTNEAAVDSALIAVEKTKAPILLLSGDQDAMWPASMMGARVCKTANTAGGTCTHAVYADGDHLLTNHPAEMFDAVGQFLARVSANSRDR